MRARSVFVTMFLFLFAPTFAHSAEVFADDFDDGTLEPDWDASPSAIVTASTNAARDGSYGLRVDASGGVATSARARLVVDPAVQASSFRLSFDVRFVGPLSLSVSGQVEVPIVSAQLGSAQSNSELFLYAVNLGSASSPDLRWVLKAMRDNGTYAVATVSGDSPPIVAGQWQQIDLVFVAANEDQNDGRVQLFVGEDPNPALELTGIDNDGQTELSELRLGIPGVVSSSATFYGIVDFDNARAESLFSWGDGFESGTTGAWDSSAGVSVINDPSVGDVLEVDAQGLSGQTARVEKNFTTESFGSDLLFEFDFFSAEDLSFPASGAQIPSVGIFSAELAGEEGSPDVVLRIYNINPGGTQDLRWGLRAVLDNGSSVGTPANASAPPVELDRWLHLRLAYRPADPGLSNGVVQLFVDDDPFPILELTGLDTDTLTTLSEARLGVPEIPQYGSLTGPLLFSTFRTRALPLPIPVPSDTILQDDGVLYRVTLWEDFDASLGQLPSKKVIEGGALGAKVHSEATVTVTKSVQQDGSIEWGIQVAPTGDYGVYRVEFPLLVANPIRGLGDERLIVPDGIGRVIADPLGATESVHPASHIPIQKHAVWYGTYGSKFQTLPLLAYEKGARGTLLYTKDPNLFIKDFEFSGDTEPSYYGRGRRIAVHHYPANTGAPGVGWSNPYPVVTREYTSGWFDAVRTHYRPWALQQKWADAGSIMARLRSGELPGWYVNNSVWTSGIATQELPLLPAIRDRLQSAVASEADEPDPEIGVFLSQWQQDPFNNVLPRFFPPESHTPSTLCPDCWYFDYIDLEDTGLRIAPYFNLHVAQVASGSLVTPELPFEDPATPNEPDPDPPSTESILSEELEGLFPANTYREEGGVFVPMCRGADDWRAYFREITARNLQSHEPELFDDVYGEFGEYGTDVQYYDQVVPGSVYPCFATDHGHDPGFGDYILEGVRGLAADAIADAGGPRILFAEGNFEGNVEAIQESYATEPAWWGVLDSDDRIGIVPLFPAVYHGYTSLHEWPNHLVGISSETSPDLDAFASALAMPAHLGHKVGSFNTTITWKKLYTSSGCRTESADACAVLDDLVVVTSRTMDAWAYGERLADPSVPRSDAGPNEGTASWCSVFDSQAGTCTTYEQVRRPIVEASLWRSLVDNNRKALVLSNWSGSSATVSLTTADLSGGTTLYDVQAGANVTYNPGVQVTVAARDWRVFVTEVVSNPDGDFVPQASDNCPDVRNPDQLDSNDDDVGDACSTVVVELASVAGEDGWVREDEEDDDVGFSVAGAGVCPGLRIGDDNLDRQLKGIVSFDTSGLPDSAVVTSARLTLHRNVSPFGSPALVGNLRADVLGGVFSGSASLEASDFEATGGVFGGNLVEGSSTHFVDLEEYGLAEIDPTGHTQIKLSLDATDDDDGLPDQWRFCAGDTTDEELRPTLEIHYTD